MAPSLRSLYSPTAIWFKIDLNNSDHRLARMCEEHLAPLFLALFIIFAMISEVLFCCVTQGHDLEE